MNWDTLENAWEQFQGTAKKRWERLTGQDWSSRGRYKEPDGGAPGRSRPPGLRVLPPLLDRHGHGGAHTPWSGSVQG